MSSLRRARRLPLIHEIHRMRSVRLRRRLKSHPLIKPPCVRAFRPQPHPPELPSRPLHQRCHQRAPDSAIAPRRPHIHPPHSAHSRIIRKGIDIQSADRDKNLAVETTQQRLARPIVSIRTGAALLDQRLDKVIALAKRLAPQLLDTRRWKLDLANGCCHGLRINSDPATLARPASSSATSSARIRSRDARGSNQNCWMHCRRKNSRLPRRS